MGPDTDTEKMNGIYKDRILVTGGAGFIGSCLVAKLLCEGHQVVALDNFSTSPLNTLRSVLANPDFTLVQANIADPIPDEIEPCSRIYHLACPASPRYFSTDPVTILDTCYFGTRNVLEKARQWNARVLLASTSEVYGQPERNIQAETYFGNVNCFGPRSCYDEGKRVAEALAFAYRVQHSDSPEIRIARIFNAYGPGMHASDGRVVTNFIGAALRGEELVITGDGKSTRCFQYVDDCVAGLTSLMESSWQHGPVNIGCEKETTIRELADLVAKTVSDITGGPQVGIVYGDPLPDDPLQRRPDCTLARKVLGWNIKTDLVEGLRRTIDWHISVSKI